MSPVRSNDNEQSQYHVSWRRTNPSVSVTEDQEGTYTVDLYLSYSDGEPVQGATYTLTDQSGAVFEGTLDNNGKASVGGVAPGEFAIEYGEDSRDLCRMSQLRPTQTSIQVRTLN